MGISGLFTNVWRLFDFPAFRAIPVRKSLQSFFVSRSGEFGIDIALNAGGDFFLSRVKLFCQRDLAGTHNVATAAFNASINVVLEKLSLVKVNSISM